jgi:hypothetical protein
MTITLRRLYSEQSALEAAQHEYRELRDRLLHGNEERTARLAERAYARGSAVLESLMERASEDELEDGEQALMDMFLTSARSSDPEQQRMWLGLLPESVDRLFGSRLHEPVPVRRVAEEPALYEVVSTRRTIGLAGSVSRVIERSRWGHPSAV